MKKFSSFGWDERLELQDFAFLAHRFKEPLSGYLAGQRRGGQRVTHLEDAWCEIFGCKHAVAVNSATSGLMAASFAVGLEAGDKFVCSPMTMSATAAAPMFTGAMPVFHDVEDETFGLVCGPMPEETKAIFSTNLFGHPAPLGRNEWDKTCKVFLIEDNAQSPFAMAHGRYCGTMGHIGVWSLNIHKPIQCGEGGMVTTDDDELARKLRSFINHGENVGDRIGLNLRMPELCAAVALAQLQRGPQITEGRIEQAETLLYHIGDIPGLRRPVERRGVRNVFYTIPFLVEQNRAHFVSDVVLDADIPLVVGYVPPLYRLPAFAACKASCPVAEDLHDRRLFYFENCAWDLDKADMIRIGDAFKRAAEKWL